MLDLSPLRALGSRHDEIGRLTDRQLSPMFRFVLRARIGAIAFTVLLAALLAAFEQEGWKTGLAAAASIVLLVLSVRDRAYFDAPQLPPRKTVEILGSVMAVHMVLITLTGGIHSPLVVVLPAVTFLAAATVGRAGLVAIPVMLAVVFVWALTLDDFGPYRLVPPNFAEALPSLGGPAFGITMATVLSVVMVATSIFGLLLRGSVEQAIRGAAEARAETLATMRDRNQELWRLSGAVAHELKNPLASVKGLSSLLARRLEPGTKQAERMTVLIEEVERMGSTIEEFLNFSRPLTQMTRRETSPEQLVERAALLHRPLAAAAEVSIETESSATGRLSCDPRKVAQVLSNLLLNAIEASPVGGTVTLRTRDDGDDGVLVEILDEGPGLDGEVRPRLFRPGATTKASGSGIGLTVARAIAEQHEGSLELLDRPRGGCLAELRLPRRMRPSPSPSPPSSGPESQESP